MALTTQITIIPPHWRQSVCFQIVYSSSQAMIVNKTSEECFEGNSSNCTNDQPDSTMNWLDLEVEVQGQWDLAYYEARISRCWWCFFKNDTDVKVLNLMVSDLNSCEHSISWMHWETCHKPTRRTDLILEVKAQSHRSYVLNSNPTPANTIPATYFYSPATVGLLDTYNHQTCRR